MYKVLTSLYQLFRFIVYIAYVNCLISTNVLGVAQHEGMMRPGHIFMSQWCVSSCDGVNEDRDIAGRFGLYVCAVVMTQTLVASPWTIPRFPYISKMWFLERNWTEWT